MRAGKFQMGWASHVRAAIIVLAAVSGLAQAAPPPATPAPAPGGTGEFAAPNTAPAGSIWAPAPAEPLPPRVTRDERMFLREAMSSSRFWIEASRMAVQKARRPYVKELAGASLDYHLRAQGALERMARARGLTPTMLHTEQRKILNSLAKANGTKFDNEYLAKVAIKDHRDEIWLYERALRETKDAELQAWIDASLPNLRTHLVLAEDAARRAEGKPARERKV
ncbi:MAG: DUF4142 domain-containing protein [Burkholderiaceae bacterium]